MQDTGVFICFSGGGVRCLYQSVFLDLLEQRLGRPLHEWVEGVAGFSGGALALLPALTQNPLSVSESKARFLTWAARMVCTKSRWQTVKSVLHTAFSPFYSNAFLKNAVMALGGLDGSETLEALRTEVYVPSWDVCAERERIATRASHGLVVEALLQACAFPTVFEPYQGAIDGYFSSNDLPLKAFLHTMRTRSDVQRWIVVSVDVSSKPRGFLFRRFLSGYEYTAGNRMLELWAKTRPDVAFFSFMSAAPASITTFSFSKADQAVRLAEEAFSNDPTFERLVKRLRETLPLKKQNTDAP